jgi:hypothetical protein
MVLADSMFRLCPRTCESSHLGDGRRHLPSVLVRATHDGSPNGWFRPTSQLDEDGSMWPRNRHRPPNFCDEVTSHLDKDSDMPTHLLSFTTWYYLRWRIDKWREAGVKNIRVHFIVTLALPATTEIYRATGLVEHFGLDRKPYYEEEYLIRGPVDRTAIIHSFPDNGEDTLTEIPLFGYHDPIFPFNSDKDVPLLPRRFFGDAALDERIDDYFETLKALGNANPLCRLVLDALTRGRFFTVKDCELYGGEIGSSV